MRAAHEAWRELIGDLLGPAPAPHVAGEDPIVALWYPWDAVERAASRLAASPLGDEWEARLPVARPHLLGVSLLWAGQVVPALAVAILSRRRWPGVPVIFGGPHVTALAEWIAREPRYGRWVDGFVAGYAEATFEAMLHRPSSAVTDVAGVMKAGAHRVGRASGRVVIPSFRSLGLYGSPRLTLPTQASRGCAYGRCAFCTYPSTEGRYRPLPLAVSRHVVREARELGADVSFKDAFVHRKALLELGDMVAGDVRWSACTRLVPPLKRQDFQRLCAQGLRTLELGVETLDPATLATLDKRQGERELFATLAAASGTRVHLLLNTMFGFPHQTASNAYAELERLGETIPRGYPETRVSLETNLLQIQRNSPMGRDPSRYGVRTLGDYPWATTLPWDAPAWRDELVTHLRTPRRTSATPPLSLHRRMTP